MYIFFILLALIVIFYIKIHIYINHIEIHILQNVRKYIMLAYVLNFFYTVLYFQQSI